MRLKVQNIKIVAFLFVINSHLWRYKEIVVSFDYSFLPEVHNYLNLE